jgi:23S rRNA (adenine2503-C2)-methyltransferase
MPPVDKWAAILYYGDGGFFTGGILVKCDKNQKILVPLADGLAVEAVWYGSGTLCISSQAGCAIGCPFCASGFSGWRRNLSTEELFLQLATARERGVEPQRVTVSGVGEPLHNPDAVADFIVRCRQQGMSVSLTTTGSPLPVLRQFLLLPHNGLMLSLHAGSAATHRRLIPHGPDLDNLWALLEGVLPTLSRRRRRKIGINYLLLAGHNDSAVEVHALAERLQRLPEITIHLLTCNPVEGSTFTSPPSGVVDAAHALLAARGLNVRRPNRWRTLAEGGCGTLLTRVGGSA